MEETEKILIVDDEKPLLESYAAILEARYEVETANSGDEALSTVDQKTDVVVLDRRLPEYSGAEILSGIRERDLDCQVLFCSAVIPDVDIVSIEPDDYLHKPIGVEELFEAVQAQLDRASHDEEVQRYLRLDALKTTLEAAQPRSRLEATDAYQDLTARWQEAKENELVKQANSFIVF